MGVREGDRAHIFGVGFQCQSQPSSCRDQGLVGVLDSFGIRCGT